MKLKSAVVVVDDVGPVGNSSFCRFGRLLQSKIVQYYFSQYARKEDSKILTYFQSTNRYAEKQTNIDSKSINQSTFISDTWSIATQLHNIEKYV